MCYWWCCKPYSPLWIFHCTNILSSQPGSSYPTLSLPLPPDAGDLGEAPLSMPKANPIDSGAASQDHLVALQPCDLSGLDLDGNPTSIELPKLQMTQSFIDLLCVAVLVGSA